MTKDKRRYPRVQAKNVSAHLNVADRSSPCSILDISAGGIFIESADALPVGMPVAVNLARPGWAKVVRVSGRVVWALAERTAAKKGILPGMRIKFDALSKATASDLMKLLNELGVGSSPEPLITAELDERTAHPISPTELQAQVVEAAPEGGRPSAPGPARPTGPRFPLATGQEDGARLAVQVQGLMMQLGDLQDQLGARDRELAELKETLKEREGQLDRSNRERKAAELAIHRLSMQLSTRG